MKDKVIQFQKYLREGYTQRKAALLSGLLDKSTTYYIKKYNLEVIRKFGKYRSNDNYFDIIDDENKAYLLGFFIADGYVTSDKRICFNNSIDDLEIVEKANLFISPESKLYFSNKQTGAKFRKEQVSLRFKSGYMCDILKNRYDIIQTKTLHSDFKFNFELIPKELINHFIRGYFDGDGSVSFYKTNNTIFFNFSFVFNSLKFTEQISNIFIELFDIIPVIREKKGKTCTYYTLRFNYSRNRVSKIQEIYNWLYKDSSICLNRKKDKFEQYFEYRANSNLNKLE